MSIQQKIATITANFIVAEVSWLPWLLVGFSMGGLAVVLQRAFSLILGSARLRNLKARFRRGRGGHVVPAELSRSLILSSGW